MAWLGTAWTGLVASPSLLAHHLPSESLIWPRGHLPHCQRQGLAAHGLSMRGWHGGFWLQCVKPPPPRTAQKAPKAIKQLRKNDSG